MKLPIIIDNKEKNTLLKSSKRLFSEPETLDVRKPIEAVIQLKSFINEKF